MTSVAQPGDSQPYLHAADESIYGWRDVVVTLPDGRHDVIRYPLTLDDVLHPQLGDVVVTGTLHDLVRDYLADVFRAYTYHDLTALVISDTGVYWDDPELKHHAPDVGAIFGVSERDRNRTSFDVAVEGVRPRVLVEVVSPNTRENDVETKFVKYHQARVPYYIILDRQQEGDR
jgi:Uma2 family endonuclease